jgi:23S rRNA pseudouridine1911/1915/1917 synthase
VEVLVEENRLDAGKVEAVPGPVDVVYEDEDLILLNKPAGIAVHPSHGHYRDTLANFLQYYLAQKGNFAPVRAVGRLDKETSGIVVFAKNQLTAARLGSRKDSIQKEYLALVHGHFQDKEGLIDAPIARVTGELNKMEVATHGKPARTHYQVQKECGDDTLLSLHLDTGRTHQIRVHMASIGHPLVGDQIYGTTADPGFSRAALHCFRVKITHPYTGELLKFEVPLPADMRRCYNQGKA